MFLVSSVLITILFFSCIFLSVGLIFLGKFKINNFFLVMSSSFFIGIVVFLFFWRTVSLFTNDAKISCFLTTISFTLLIFKEIKFLYIFFKNNFRKFLYLFFLLLAFIGVYTVYSLVPMPDLFVNRIAQTNPGYGFRAVAHSLRAGNIAIYIFQNNFIPLFTQNYGQSLLATIPMFFGFSAPQLALVVWLATNIFFLGLFIYGLIYYFIGQKIPSAIGALVSVFGNTALSLSYIETIDTGSTNLLITNVDTIIGIIIFIFFIFCCFSFVKPYEKVDKKYLLFYIFICGFVWNIVAAHNIIIVPIYLLVLFFYFKKENIYQHLKNFFTICIFFFIGAVSGILISGGMLMPYRFSDHIDIPGLMSVYSPNSKYPILELRPKMFLMNYDTFAQSKNIIKSIIFQSSVDHPQTINKISQSIKVSDSSSNSKFFQTILGAFKRDGSLRFLVNFIIIFFPIFGLWLSFYLNKKLSLIESAKKDFDNDGVRLLKLIWWTGSVLFVVGVFFSAFVVLFGREIEMSRFMGVGNFIAMFFLGLSASLVFKYRSIFKMPTLILLSTIFIFCIAGPILQFGLVRLVGNFVLQDKTDSQIFSLPPNLVGRTLTMSERFQAMLNINSMAGENFVDNHKN